MKPVQIYLIKIWCSGIVLSPVISTLLLMGNIPSHHSPFEIPLIIGFSMILGVIYLSPSLLISCFAVNYVKETSKNKKLIATAYLLVLALLQLSLLYKWNLSFIYKGAGVMTLTYVIVFFIAVLVFKIKQPLAKL